MSAESSGQARIVARGFQRYDGPRSGVGGAIRSVTWQSFRAALGLGRLARHKIVPFISAFIAYVPAIVFVGVAVLIPGDILDPNEIADYAGYYGVITLAITLFVAVVGPEILVTDRRSGMLAMYLSTPLNRLTYLTSKAAAILTSLLLVTLGPPLLLLIGYTAEGVGPEGLRDWLAAFARVVVSGIAVAAILGAIAMAAASLTDRRAFAAVGVVLVLFIAPIIVAVLVEEAEWSDNLWALSPPTMAQELVYRIFGSDVSELAELSTELVLGACAAWTAVSIAVVGWRYSRMVIAR